MNRIQSIGTCLIVKKKRGQSPPSERSWKGMIRVSYGKNGATVRSRTADILITSEVLYQLSYGGS